jgi:hypothetical protein
LLKKYYSIKQKKDKSKISYQSKYNSFIGWCAVQRYLPPLKEYNAVLVQTKNATLSLRHNVLFQDYNIRVNNFDSNILWDECHYDPDEAPNCPKFVLNDIIKYTVNAEVPYEKMAKFGATIVIAINWKCKIDGFLGFFRKNYSSLYDCKPKYSFTRVDNILKSPYTGNRTYWYAHYFGNMRTHYLSYRIRFVVRVTGEVEECDIYHLSHEMITMYGVFCALVALYQLYITLYKYKDKNFETIIPVNESERIPVDESERIPVDESERIPVNESERMPVNRSERIPVNESESITVNKSEKTPLINDT